MGFKHVTGTTPLLFVVLAALAWLLLPLAHPVYVVTVAPCIVAGVAFALWRVKRQPPKPAPVTTQPTATRTGNECGPAK